MLKSVTTFAPATVANVGCGFDIFGFAVDEPGDIVKVTLRETSGVEIVRITGDDGRLPKSAEKNTAGFAALHYLKTIKSNQSVEIELNKNMPLGSGMGSSAASAVAVLFAINRLFEHALSKHELLPIAIEAEKLACGSAHADNVAPALFGGFVLIRENNPPDIIELPVPAELHCSLIHPEIEIRTEDARNILDPMIPLKDAVKQWANTAGLVAGLYSQDYELIGRSLQDHIVEPHRAALIPYFHKIKQAALQAGAMGCSISGSGPSIFALSRSRPKAQTVADAMQAVLNREGIDNQVYVSGVNQNGPKIIDQEE